MPSRSNTNSTLEPAKTKPKWTSRVGSAVRKASKKLSISSSSKSGSGDTSVDRAKGASVDIPRSASPDFELISPVNPPAGATSTPVPLATSASSSTTATTLTTTTTPAGPVSSSTSMSSTSIPLSLKTPANVSLAVHAPSPIAESPAREADAMMQDVIRGPGVKDSSITAELERVEKESSSTIGKLPEIPNIMTSPLYVEPPIELPLVVVDQPPVVKPKPAPVVKAASREPSPAPAAKASSRSASPSPAVKPTSRSASPAPAPKVSSRSPSPAPIKKPASLAPSASSSTKSLVIGPLDIEPSPGRSVSTSTSASTSKVAPFTSTPAVSTSQAEVSGPPVARAGRSTGSRPLSIFVDSASSSNTPALSVTPSAVSMMPTPPTIPATVAATPSPQPAPTPRPQTKTLFVPRPQSQFISSPSAPPGLGPEPTLSSGDLVPPMVTIHPATPIMWTRSLQDEEDEDVSDSSSDDDEVPYGLVFRPKPVPTPTPPTPPSGSTGTISEPEFKPIPTPTPSTTSKEPTPQPASGSSSSTLPSVPLSWPLPPDTSVRRPSVSSVSDNEQELELDSADVTSSRESTPPITPPAHHIEFAPMIQVLGVNSADDHAGDGNGKQQWPMLNSDKSDEPVPSVHGGEEDGDIPNIPSFESPSSLRGSFYSPMSSLSEQRMRVSYGQHGRGDADSEDTEEEEAESPFGPVPHMDDIPAIPSIIDPSEETAKARTGVLMLGGHAIGGYAQAEEEESERDTEKDTDAESGSTHTNMSDVDNSEKDFDPEEMRAGAEGVSEDVSKDDVDPFADPMDSNAAWDDHWQTHAGRRRSYSLPQMTHDSGEEDLASGHDQSFSSSDAHNTSYASNSFSFNTNNSFNASNPYGSSNTNSYNTTYGSNNPFASKSETQLPILHDLNHALLGTPEPAQRLPPPPVLPYSATLSDDVLGRSGLSSLSGGLSSSVLAAPMGIIASGFGAVGSSSGSSSRMAPLGSSSGFVSSQAASTYATANPSPVPTPPMIPRPYHHIAADTAASTTLKQAEPEVESLSYPYSPPTSPVIPGAYSSPTIPSFSSSPPTPVPKVETPHPLRADTRAATPPPLTARAFTPPPQTARAFTPPPLTARAFTPPPTIPRPYSPQARIYAHGQFVDPSLKRKEEREASGGLSWDPLGSNANASSSNMAVGQKKASPSTVPLALPIPFPEFSPSSSTAIKDPLTSDTSANDRDLEKGPELSPAYSDDIDAEGDIDGEGEGYVRVGKGNMSPFDPISIGAFSSGYGPLVGSSSPVVGGKSESEEVMLTSVEVGREAADIKGDGAEIVGGTVREREHERERDMRNPFDSMERLGSTSSITLLNPGGIPLTSTSATIPTSGFEQKHPGDSTMSLGSSSGLVDTLPHPNTETTRGGNVRRGSGQFAELQAQRGQNANTNANEGDHDYTRWTVIGVVGTLAGVVTTGLLLGLRRIGVGIPDDRLGGAGNSGGRGGRQREPQFAALDLSSMGRSVSTGWMEVGARGRRLVSESMTASTSSTTPPTSSSSSSKKPRSPTQTTQPAPSLGMSAPALGMRRAHSHIPIRSNGQHHPTKMALFLDILHSGPGVIGGLIFGGPTHTSTANVGLNPSLQSASSSARPITRTTGKGAKDDVGLGMISRRDSDQNSSSGLIMNVDDSDVRENGGMKGDGAGGGLRAGVLYVRDTVVWAFGRVSGWGVSR